MSEHKTVQHILIRGRIATESNEDPLAMSQVVIASRLSDGIVVFLSRESSATEAVWALTIGESEIAADDARAAELLALGESSAAETHIIVDPYLIEVAEEDGQLRPTKYREAIRALGPTIRTDLGKQAEGAEV